MQRCNVCGFATHAADELCAHCGATSTAVDESGVTTIARFGNAAEAGYFANELATALDCEPILSLIDELDPVTHAWQPQYVLSVPLSAAADATALLRELIQETSDLEPVGGAPVASRDTDGRTHRDLDSAPVSRTSGGPHWVPIMITVAAGSFALWAGRKPPVARAVHENPGQPAMDLWDALSAQPGPWRQQLHGGPGTQELEFDAVHKTATLRVDIDGDGRFDIVQRLRQ